MNYLLIRKPYEEVVSGAFNRTKTSGRTVVVLAPKDVDDETLSTYLGEMAEELKENSNVQTR